MSLYGHPRVDSMFDARAVNRVSHFRARRRALSIATRTLDCVRRDSPTRARARFSKSFFRGPRSFARNAYRRIALPSLCSLGPLVAENCFHNLSGFPARFLRWNGFRCTAATPRTGFAYLLATPRLHPATASTAEEFGMVRPPELHDFQGPPCLSISSEPSIS